MGNTKEINIKNQAYYFFDDMINIKDFDPNLLKKDKKSYKNIKRFLLCTNKQCKSVVFDYY